MSRAALLKISNLKKDDLFLNFDADEIPKTEVSVVNKQFSVEGAVVVAQLVE